MCRGRLCRPSCSQNGFTRAASLGVAKKGSCMAIGSRRREISRRHSYVVCCDSIHENQLRSQYRRAATYGLAVYHRSAMAR